MSNVLEVESGGIKFNVKIVREGDKYGLNNCLTHTNPATMVEFYDSRHPHTEHGQFVSRYYLHTLLERELNQGINLDGGVEAWKINGEAMNAVATWLSSQNNVNKNEFTSHIKKNKM